jgi:predicted DNA binding CopG/RHH family protein
MLSQIFAKLNGGKFMKDEVRLNVKLSADLLERVKAVAEKKQLNVSALTRLLLINYVEKCENEERLNQSKD